MAVCVAVLDRNSSPLILSTNDPAKELDFHYIVHTSIDVINEKCQGSSVNPQASGGGGGGGKSGLDSTPNAGNANAQRELYLGVLYSTEQYKVFGYVTNTKIKFVIIVESTLLRDNEIRQMFRKLHLGYAALLSNPFYIPGTSIRSKKFNGVIQGLMTTSAAPKASPSVLRSGVKKV